MAFYQRPLKRPDWEISLGIEMFVALGFRLNLNEFKIFLSWSKILLFINVCYMLSDLLIVVREGRILKNIRHLQDLLLVPFYLVIVSVRG